MPYLVNRYYNKKAVRAVFLLDFILNILAFSELVRHLNKCQYHFRFYKLVFAFSAAKYSDQPPRQRLRGSINETVTQKIPHPSDTDSDCVIDTAYADCGARWYRPQRLE